MHNQTWYSMALELWYPLFSIQQRAIDIAHEGPQGQKKLLLEKVWFPGIEEMVKTTIDNCIACQANMQLPDFTPSIPDDYFAPKLTMAHSECWFLRAIPNRTVSFCSHWCLFPISWSWNSALHKRKRNNQQTWPNFFLSWNIRSPKEWQWPSIFLWRIQGLHTKKC